MLVLLTLAGAQQQPSSAPSTAKADDPSGMYSFLKDGEFVQLTVDDGKLSGYVSRFGESESDKGTFIDQFFDKASLDGNRLAFTTKTVHGTWYEFKGVITITPGKQPPQEDYRVIKGTLIEHIDRRQPNRQAAAARSRVQVLSARPQQTVDTSSCQDPFRQLLRMLEVLGQEAGLFHGFPRFVLAASFLQSLRL